MFLKIIFSILIHIYNLVGMNGIRKLNVQIILHFNSMHIYVYILCMCVCGVIHKIALLDRKYIYQIKIT